MILHNLKTYYRESQESFRATETLVPITKVSHSHLPALQEQEERQCAAARRAADSSEQQALKLIII